MIQDLPPHAFPYYDSKGMIQYEDNIPIIYHIKKNKADKKLIYKSASMNDHSQVYRYSTSIPEVDKQDSYRVTSNYWWDPGDKFQILQLKKKTES